MIEVNTWLFWGICAMAAVGFLQALSSVLHKEPEQDWTKGEHSPPGEAPEGFRWVLIPED